MNIYIEYYKFSDDRKNNHAQMKEQAKWTPPDPSICLLYTSDAADDW